jgi:hypothetical protein
MTYARSPSERVLLIMKGLPLPARESLEIGDTRFTRFGTSQHFL